MSRTYIDYINCYLGQNNTVVFTVPKYIIVFDESDKRLRTSTLNSRQSRNIHKGIPSIQFSVTLCHTPVDNFIGLWEYEHEDLSIFLTNKTKLPK